MVDLGLLISVIAMVERLDLFEQLNSRLSSGPHQERSSLLFPVAFLILDRLQIVSKENCMKIQKQICL